MLYLFTNYQLVAGPIKLSYESDSQIADRKSQILSQIAKTGVLSNTIRISQIANCKSQLALEIVL